MSPQLLSELTNTPQAFVHYGALVRGGIGERREKMERFSTSCSPLDSCSLGLGHPILLHILVTSLLFKFMRPTSVSIKLGLPCDDGEPSRASSHLSTPLGTTKCMSTTLNTNTYSLFNWSPIPGLRERVELLRQVKSAMRGEDNGLRFMEPRKAVSRCGKNSLTARL
jgi:hypothetical protein